jgi:hypothetical protein
VMTAPESERAAIRAEWPTEFNDGARCGFSGEFDGPREQGGYPVGFHKWPLECRTAWTKGFVTKRAAKMIERPDYYTKEQWQEYLRTAKEPKPKGCKTNGEAEGKPETIIVDITSIKPEPIDWLWKYWRERQIAHHRRRTRNWEKTTICLSFIAAISSGGKFPDSTTAPAGNCLIWPNEGGLADTISAWNVNRIKPLIVVPIETIIETINQPILVEWRRQQIQYAREKLGAVPDTLPVTNDIF